MPRYRSRSRSYSPRRRSSKRYDDDDPRDRRRDRRSPLPSGLLVRNLPLDARPEELRMQFERYGPVKDVYLPKDYYTGEPRGFGFVKFRYGEDAVEAKHHLDHTIFGGREIRIVFAEENRKTPQEMRTMTRVSGRDRGTYRRRSPSRSPRRRYRSHSRSPLPAQHDSRDRKRGTRDRYHSPIRSRSITQSPSQGRDYRSNKRSPVPEERDYRSNKRSPTSEERDYRLNKRSPPLEGGEHRSNRRTPSPQVGDYRSSKRSPSPDDGDYRLSKRSPSPDDGDYRSYKRSPPEVRDYKSSKRSSPPERGYGSKMYPSPKKRDYSPMRSLSPGKKGHKSIKGYTSSNVRNYDRLPSPDGRDYRSIQMSQSPHENGRNLYGGRGRAPSGSRGYEGNSQSPSRSRSRSYSP